MAKQTIGLGTAANDGTGDSLRTAGDKINDNFDEVYDLVTLSGPNLLLGRFSSGAGVAEEISLGAGVSAEGGVLRAATGALSFPLSGTYHDGCQPIFGSPATLAVTADRIQLHPFTPSHDITCDNVGINVTVAGAAATTAKILIYNAHATTGWPDALVLESPALATDSTGYKSHAYAFTFKKGRVYWLGARFSGTPTVSALPNASLRAFGRTGPASNPATSLNTLLAFATPATNPFVVTSAMFASTNPPAVFIHEA